jgi:DNA-binding NarL/FixJ family response regulator
MYLNLNESVDGECWKPIPNYVGLYEISNYGRIRKCDCNKIMKQNFSQDYLVIGLSDGSRIRKTHRVHRLVAMAFNCSDNPHLEVNHINGVKSDNRDINLEWISHSENSKHTFVSGNKTKKLTPEMVMKIKKMLKNGCIQKEIAEKFNVSTATISEINTNKKWINIK